MNAQLQRAMADPASFHDPSSGVLGIRGRVWRWFDARGREGFRALVTSGVLDRLVKQEWVIPYAELGQAEADEVKSSAPHAESIIEHPVIPFISYAYEWPFNMLKDAALLLLDVLKELLEAGFVLKDGTSSNVQFINGRPTFIDVGSIEPYVEGRVWAGYTQFCSSFLNPLLLQTATGLPFQPWLRGSPSGISPEVLYRLLSWPARLWRGAFVHVTLQTWLNRLFASAPDISSPLKRRTSVSRQALIRQVLALRHSIERLRARQSSSLWLNYDSSGSYLAEASQAKRALVESQLAALAPRVVYDCGCNVGDYSLCAARQAKLVVAMDFDPAVVDAVYLRTRGLCPNILPLVMDLTNPSPDQGWAQAEHRGLRRRGPADLVLWLALTHHLGLTYSIPPEQQIAWIADLAPSAIVEFVPASDPRAQTLLRWHADPGVHYSYTRETMEKALGQHFLSLQTFPLPNSDRILYVASRQSTGK